MQEKKINTIEGYTLAEKCCGCTACYNVCPVNAIQMVQNEKGFFVPVVSDKCINCGLCKKVCQIDTSNSGIEPTCKYGVVNSDNECRMKSSSGGVFSLIIESMSEEWGKKFHCFGAIWDNELNVKHVEAIKREEFDKFKGSKYVQSDLSDVFTKIAELLKNDEWVLFSGTGCQCAGLRKYLETKKINDNKLFVVDVVCHGVPSSKLWKDYIATLEEGGKKVTYYSFRNKEEGWRGLRPNAKYEDGTLVPKDKILMSYGKMFGNLSLNEICYSCKYANTKRNGDITLGDYWGIENSSCNFDDNKGVSLCLVNTKKGMELFEKIQSKLKVYEINDNSYLQPQLMHATRKNVLCDNFWRDYKRKGYRYVAKKYTASTRFYRGIISGFAIIKKIIKK